MSAMLRDKSAFKLALGAGVVVAGATGALWYLRRGQTKRPAKGPTVGESPAQPPATEPQTAVKTAVEAKDPLPPSPPPAAEKQVSVDHGEETIKSAQRISIQIPVPPADGDASVGSMSPDNLSITSETFEKVSPSQLGSQSNTPPALSTPPYPPKDTESLGESFGSTALGESFEQVSLGSQLKEEEKEEKERAEREKEEKEEGKKEEKEEEKEEKKDAPQVKTEEVKTEEAKDEVVKEEPPLKEEEVNDTVHVTTESALEEPKKEATPPPPAPSQSASSSDAAVSQFNSSVTSPVFAGNESAEKISSEEEKAAQLSEYDASRTHPASLGYDMK